jgi:multicomponent Na+:H+ antiporter subunit D
MIVIILLATVIEGIYFVRLLVKLWYKGENEVDVKYALSYKIVFVLIALIILTFGTYSTPLNHFDNSIDSISEVIDNE